MEETEKSQNDIKIFYRKDLLDANVMIKETETSESEKNVYTRSNFLRGIAVSFLMLLMIVAVSLFNLSSSIMGIILTFISILLAIGASWAICRNYTPGARPKYDKAPFFQGVLAGAVVPIILVAVGLWVWAIVVNGFYLDPFFGGIILSMGGTWWYISRVFKSKFQTMSYLEKSGAFVYKNKDLFYISGSASSVMNTDATTADSMNALLKFHDKEFLSKIMQTDMAEWPRYAKYATYKIEKVERLNKSEESIDCKCTSIGNQKPCTMHFELPQGLSDREELIKILRALS